MSNLSMPKTFPTLYARAIDGIKEWSVTAEDHGRSRASVNVTYGAVNGKLRTDTYHVTEGKNLGKSNATNYFTQAVSEAESKWTHKLKQGYKSLEGLGIGLVPTGFTFTDHENISHTTSNLHAVLDVILPEFNTDASGNIKPMKCQPYYSKSDNPKVVIKFPCLGQPKLNGFRCVMQLVNRKGGLFQDSEIVFRSKEGLEYKSLTHISSQLSFGMFEYQGTELIFDGEVYLHGASLQDIASATKKFNSLTPKLKFYIFDLAIPEATQEERLVVLSKVTSPNALLAARISDTNTMMEHDLHNSTLPYRVVSSKWISSDEEAQKFTDLCITGGFEGAVFRAPHAQYQFGKRPSTITKLKRFKDAEFRILDVVLPDNCDPRYSVLLCMNDKNTLTFKAAIEGTFDYRESLYLNKESVIGLKATIKFYERTNDELPFHAVVQAIRDYE